MRESQSQSGTLNGAAAGIEALARLRHATPRNSDTAHARLRVLRVGYRVGSK